jgi:4-azaleucine resistance transporter AzlC
MNAADQAAIGAPPEAPGSFRGEIRAGMQAGTPLAIAVFGFGVSFGVLARSADIGLLPAVVMSATTFAGSAQFAAAAVLDGGGGVAAAILAAVLLNARYLPMGISLAPAMDGAPLRRFLPPLLMSDESWAVAHLGGGRYSKGRLLGAGVLVYVAWIAGTAVGVLGAQVLGRPEQFGFDVVAPAIFLALLVNQIRDRRAAVAAVLGAAIAMALTPFTSPGIPLIAAIGAALVGLLGGKR